MKTIFFTLILLFGLIPVAFCQVKSEMETEDQAANKTPSLNDQQYKVYNDDDVLVMGQFSDVLSLNEFPAATSRSIGPGVEQSNFDRMPCLILKGDSNMLFLKPDSTTTYPILIKELK